MLKRADISPDSGRKKRRVDSVLRSLASSQLEASKADQKAAYADLLPKISGSADYGASGTSPERSSDTYSVGVKVSVPLWEGGSQQAKVEEVKGKIKEAQENLLDAGQQAQVNIAKARAAIVEAYDLRKSKSQQLQTDQRALRRCRWPAPACRRRSCG